MPDQDKTIRVCFVIACHNRKQKTIDSIDSIFHQEKTANCDVSVILLDDGSTDGTSAAVLNKFPSVRLIRGSGNLYWNGAMRQALSAALEGDFDYYLLLNDDTRLYAKALDVLISTHVRVSDTDRIPCIVVGSTQDHENGHLTYGGWRQTSQLNPLRLVKVSPTDVAFQCDTLNGNCALLSRTVVNLVGNLDGAFTHGMGDMDYGFRARRMGGSIWVAPGFAGICDANPGKGMWADKRLSLLKRWRQMLGPKGLPPKEWLVFTYRHAGWLWPIAWVNPYVKFWIKGLLRF